MKPGDKVIVIDKLDEYFMQVGDFLMMGYQGELCVEFADGVQRDYDPFQLELSGPTTGVIMEVTPDEPWPLLTPAPWPGANAWHYEPDPTKIFNGPDNDERYYVPEEQEDGTK